MSKSRELFSGSSGEVVVPPTYQSDCGPGISLADLKAKLGTGWGPPKKDKEGRTLPLRLDISFDCNAEGVARLAEFFGLYDREAWNRRAVVLGLPMIGLPSAPAESPKLADGIVDGELIED